ncbi:50S ribosomal protein L35, partial [Methylophaga sp. UBA5063]
KRFKRTGSGKFKRAQAFTSHILTKKSTKRKRQLRSTLTICKADHLSVRKLLPLL